jgi:hypothetical protein
MDADSVMNAFMHWWVCGTVGEYSLFLFSMPATFGNMWAGNYTIFLFSKICYLFLPFPCLILTNFKIATNEWNVWQFK